MLLNNIFLVLTLLYLVSSQGGGGGSSSSGSSSNSDDSGEGRSLTKSCQEQCSGSDNIAQCESDCEDDNDNTRIIVGCIVGPLAGFGLIFYVYKKRVSLKNRFCGTKVKKDLKSEFLKSLGTCDDQQKIANSLQAINNSTWDCTYWLGSTAYHVNDFRFYGIQNSQNYDVDLIVSGEDKFGKWDGNGVVACDNTHLIHIWFLKNYQDKKKAGQTGDWTTLIYQGTIDMQYQSFNGRWWYHGFSGDAKYSGAWIMQNHTITEANN